MKTLVRSSLAIIAVLLLGVLLVHQADMRRSHLIANDEPAGKETPKVLQPPPIPTTSVAPQPAKVLPAPPMPIASAATKSKIILLTSTLYKVEPARLSADGVELYKTFTGSLAKTFVAAREGERATSIAAVISPRTVANLKKQLARSPGATILSRPQFVTQDGKSARIQVGSRVPVPGSGDVQQAAGTFKAVGITLDVIPSVTEDQLRLQATAIHTRLKGAKVETIQLLGVGELYAGESLVLCQNDGQAEQLLVIVTPGEVGPAPPTPASLPQPWKPLDAKPTREEIKRDALLKNFGPQHPLVLEQTQRLAAREQLARQQVSNEEARTAARLEALGTSLRELFADAEFDFHLVPDGVVISGTITDTQDSRVIIEIASRFFPDVISNLKVASRKEISQPRPSAQGDLQKVLNELFPGMHITTYPLNNSVVVSGNIAREQASQVLQIAEDFYPNVINHLSPLEAKPENVEPVFVSPEPNKKAPNHSPHTLNKQLRELRQEVRVLREDVRRLINLLEAPSDEAQPDRNDLGQAAARPLPNPTTLLKPNDRLTIESATDASLNRDLTVLADGTITLPLLGQVSVAGRSLVEQRVELEKRYEKYYVQPDLTLSFSGTSVPADAVDSASPGRERLDMAPDPTAMLKPGDHLRLESLIDNRLNRHLTILADGTITLPLLGQIPAAERNLKTLNQELTAQFRKIYRQPELTLSFLGTSLPPVKVRRETRIAGTALRLVAAYKLCRNLHIELIKRS